MAQSEWMKPPRVDALTGDELFDGVAATVRDFWRFAMGDLRVNNARGYLAEFLVARALGQTDVSRVEWDAYDLLLEGRIRVEVKSSAYLQAWEQRRLSRIAFSGLRGRRYHPQHDYDPGGRQLNAHVYVFCVQTATNHEDYQPLDLAQWDFYVVPKSKLDSEGQSVGLVTVAALSGGATPWADLRSVVTTSAAGETINEAPWWTE